jgi:hypothetical protein
MDKRLILIIGFLISLLVVISLGLFFNSSNRNLYLSQISSLPEEFEKISSEIQSLKKEILSLKEDFEKEKEERERLKESVLSFSQNFVTQKESAFKEIKESKESVICQKKENDLPRHRVIFNEICWMGDEESPANEWFEIKNISKEEIDISGWQVLNKNQRIKIVFEEGTKILPNGILILKRGDDFYGAIKNSDEALFLFDKDCNLEDEVFATPSWQAGDNFSKRTAERKEDLSWQTSLDPGGTPGKENSSGFVEIEKEEEEKEPKISLSFPKEVFANQEFKVSLSVSNLENETYDIKISILKISEESEKKKTISEISLTGDEWQSSYNYLQKVFTGTSFSGDFKLRISEKYQDLKGEAEILAKVRQSSNRKIVAEFKDKLRIKEVEKIESKKIERIESEVTTSSLSSPSQPQLTLSYPLNSPVNKEINIILSASNLKNSTYDVKISIEKDGKILSEIFNEKENKWQSSFYYLKEIFSGDSFSGNFKLRIKSSESGFRGNGDLIAKLRETGKSTTYLEWKGEINILEPTE